MNKKVIASIAIGTLFCGGVLAQTISGIDFEAIEAKRKASLAEADELTKLVEVKSSELRDEVIELEKGALANRESIGGKFAIGGKGEIDLDSVISQEKGKSIEGGVFVFASLSMPDQSLKKLILDSGKAGATVYFRGFPNNSMTEFKERLLPLVKDGKGSISIDPRQFRAFNIETVPVYISASTNFDLCDGFTCKTETPPFDKMSGNVTLEYALETFVDGNGPGAAVANVGLQRLKSSAK